MVALACGVVAFTPQVLSGSSSFIADNRGIFFPHHSKRRLLEWNYKDQWLLVPWHRVANVQIESVFAGEEGFRPGIALQIDVDKTLEEEFFSYLQSPLLRKREANMQLKICYANSFHSPETVAQKLLSLKTGAGQS